MNPTEIYQFITGLIRAGAEVIAGALVALGVGAFAGWKFRGWMVGKEIDALRKERDEERIRLLTEKERVNRLTGEMAEARNELVTLRAEFRIELEKEVQQRTGPLQAELDKARSDFEARARLAERYLRERNTARAQVEELKGQLTAVEETANRLTEEVRRVVREVETYRQTAETWESKFTETENELNSTRCSLDEEQKKVQELEQMIQSIRAQAGKIWERPVPPHAPRFVPLGDRRRCPIISILNLKGGVGKTTLTLNLAATLSDKGKRVLMIDCDHQRSLSALCLPQQRRVSLHNNQRTLQHFMRGAERSVQPFLNCVQELANIPKCASVINTASHTDEDGLATVEDNLMLEWVFSGGNDDVRHALRAVLHSKEVAERFDYVFLDCPPRLSTATVNAIAASDYVLIPVVLDATSATNPLPLLLRELRRLRASNLFPHFNILGVVANRVQTHAGKMVGSQWSVWEALTTPAAAGWGEPVHRFQTMIVQAAVYGKAAKVLLNDTQTAVAIWEDAASKALFSNLTSEIEKRITNEAPHLAAVPS